MVPELKPCPFCGGPASHNDGGNSVYGRLWWAVRCDACDFEVFDKQEWHDFNGPMSGLLKGKPMECIETWNRRAEAALSAAEPQPAPSVAKSLESLCAWLLHRFGPNSPEGREASWRMSALSAQVQDARSDDDEEIYEIGVREGYERAVQEIDMKTGGDGEYRYCTDRDPDRHTPGPAEMIQRIVDRFETLNLIDDAGRRGDFWDAPGSAQVQDVAIPEGWQLVPIDRTPEMIDAGTLDSPYGVSNKAWSDMLAAAPAKQEVLDTSARMENGLDWFIEAVFIDENQRRRSGRLKFLPNGQPYYEGDLSPKEFMNVFLYGALPSAEKTWPFNLPDALPIDGFGDGERTGMYSGVQISKPENQEG